MVRIVTVPRVTIVTAMWLLHGYLNRHVEYYCILCLYTTGHDLYLYKRFVFIQIICKLRWDAARKSTRNKTFALALVKICMPFYDNIFQK